MKKNLITKVLALGLSLSLGLVMSGCAAKATTTAAPAATTAAAAGETTAAQASVEFEKMTLTLGHSGSPEHHYQKSAEKLAAIVSEKTGGAVTIDIFPSDQLGTGPEELEAVMGGTQDMVITPDAFIANHEPLFNALGMPYQFASFDQVKKIPETEFAKTLEEKATAKNIVILGWMSNGFRLMTTNTPINTPEDMKGLKIRIGSAKLISDLLADLGANPTPISMSETYTAIQTGTVDGQENPTTNILNNKLYEVQKYLAITRHQYVTQPLVINKDLFDSMSPELQAIMLDAGKQVAAEDVAMVEANEAGQLEQLVANGMTVTEPDQAAFKAALAGLYDQYAQEFGAEFKALTDKIAEEMK